MAASEQLLIDESADVDFSSVPKKMRLPGCGWYQNHIWQYFGPMLQERGCPSYDQLLYEPCMDHLCLGSGACVWAKKVVSLPIKSLCGAEKRPVGRAFILRNHGGDIPHLFACNEDIVAGRGYCYVHKGPCSVPAQRADIVIGGFPCQPFTSARIQTGATPKSGPPTGHPSFGTVCTCYMHGGLCHE